MFNVNLGGKDHGATGNIHTFSKDLLPALLPLPLPAPYLRHRYRLPQPPEVQTRRPTRSRQLAHPHPILPPGQTHPPSPRYHYHSRPASQRDPRGSATGNVPRPPGSDPRRPFSFSLPPRPAPQNPADQPHP